MFDKKSSSQHRPDRPSRFLRDCISVLISRRAPDLKLLTASSVSELHSVSLSLTVLWADPLKEDATQFVQSESSLARERSPDIPVLAFVRCQNAGDLTSFMPMGITAIDVDRATPEIALAAIRLAIAGEVVTSTSLVCRSRKGSTTSSTPLSRKCSFEPNSPAEP